MLVLQDFLGVSTGITREVSKDENILRQGHACQATRLGGSAQVGRTAILSSVLLEPQDYTLVATISQFALGSSLGVPD